ncbi:hypothetical protein [Flavobacterium sp. AG291]|uniref:hypothetical protein n=1 Tax=Flavobacterium sp. AG291 TaxID=2184000 RepID=UPI000E0ABDA5|nr:hypothetical protein [Flavobacterium sp. AG291]RDI05467.1 hypothetical protein DEU42_11730 [Flavobacterium sp. AG291]
MISFNLTTYIFIILAVTVAYLVYRNRKQISNYANTEIDKIKELNYTDDEIEIYIQKYRSSDSKDLIALINRNTLSEKELRAIRKILAERELMPPPSP